VSRSDELLEDLRRATTELGGLRASVDDADQVAYARDLWPRHHMDVRAGRVAANRPGLIVWPESTADVQAVVRWARDRSIGLVPFGAGSGVCGGILPSHDIVVLDLKRMARWRRLDASAPTLEVEAGALGLPLEEELGRRGFTLGHFPSSILCSTVGGWVAGRSAGQCSGYYGKIEDMVVALECVMGDGEIVTLSRRSQRPDLTPLVIGSEGILGVVTAVTLRLHPAPNARAFAAFTFPETVAGWEAMRRVFQAGLRPAVSRLYDPFDAMLARMGSVKGRKRASAGEDGADEIERGRVARPTPGLGGVALRTVLRRPRALNELIELAGGPALGGAMLVIIFEGHRDEAAEHMTLARRVLESAGGRYDGEDQARRWLAHRYAVSYRQAPVWAAGAWVDTMEVAATWANLGALYDGVRKALGRHAFVMAHLSHAYPDGCCIYFSFAGSARGARRAPRRGADTWDAASVEAYDQAWRDALAAAEAAGGTIAHHHGVGRSKAPRLRAEIGDAVRVVRALKRALDPRAIMNPGNLLPDAALDEAGGPGGDVARQRMRLDRQSLLVEVGADVPLSELEAWLVSTGLTLGVDAAAASDASVGAWLAAGAVGARDPWCDPADHLVAGFEARFIDGSRVVERPAPRRSVGPDLLALVTGVGGRFADLSRAWLRVHEIGAPRATTAPFHAPPVTPVTASEDRLLAAIAEALRPGKERS
jgi:alkyldihydroxyacetonephosphate synthase